MSNIARAERTERITRLRWLRMQRGWSQTELSQRSKVHRATVSGAETGRLIPSADVLRALADALGYDGDPESLLAPIEVRMTATEAADADS